MSRSTEATNKTTTKHGRWKTSHGRDSPHRIPEKIAWASSLDSLLNGTVNLSNQHCHYLTQKKENKPQLQRSVPYFQPNVTVNCSNQCGRNNSQNQLSLSDSQPNGTDNERISHCHQNIFPCGRHQQNQQPPRLPHTLSFEKKLVEGARKIRYLKYGNKGMTDNFNQWDICTYFKGFMGGSNRSVRSYLD